MADAPLPSRALPPAGALPGDLPQASRAEPIAVLRRRQPFGRPALRRMGDTALYRGTVFRSAERRTARRRPSGRDDAGQEEGQEEGRADEPAPWCAVVVAGYAAGAGSSGAVAGWRRTSRAGWYASRTCARP